MMDEYALGQVVYSKAGRDAGKKFVVLELVDKDYVLLADGDLRRVEKPKKKKIKHLEPSGITIESIAEKLRNHLRVANSEIRKGLAALEGTVDGVK